MKAVIEFSALGKGLFALKKSLKVLQGAECSLIRNKLNQYGEFSASLHSLDAIKSRTIALQLIFFFIALTSGALICNEPCISVHIVFS